LALQLAGSRMMSGRTCPACAVRWSSRFRQPEPRRLPRGLATPGAAIPLRRTCSISGPSAGEGCSSVVGSAGVRSTGRSRSGLDVRDLAQIPGDHLGAEHRSCSARWSCVRAKARTGTPRSSSSPATQRPVEPGPPPVAPVTSKSTTQRPGV